MARDSTPRFTLDSAPRIEDESSLRFVSSSVRGTTTTVSARGPTRGQLGPPDAEAATPQRLSQSLRLKIELICMGVVWDHPEQWLSSCA